MNKGSHKCTVGILRTSSVWWGRSISLFINFNMDNHSIGKFILMAGSGSFISVKILGVATAEEEHCKGEIAFMLLFVLMT